MAARSAAVTAEVAESFGLAWSQIQPRVKRLTDRIERAQSAGEPVSRAWMQRLDEMLALQRQVEVSLAEFASTAGDQISAANAEAVAAARAHAATLIGTLDEVERAAFLQGRQATALRVAANAAAGTPLRDLLSRRWLIHAQGISRTIIAGAIQGINPTTIGRQIRRQVGGTLFDAVRIARTEIMRGAREASIAAYGESGEVAEWEWICALGPRSCPACVAMHGTRHPLDEPLDGHPNCRCVPAPVLPDTPPIQSGEEWLREQSLDVQVKVMGRTGQVILARGVPLRQWVRRVKSQDWGTMRIARAARDVAQL